jgi:hypothetical protein
VIDLYTKGWLPYTLRWTFRVSEINPKGYTLEAKGDFVGRGIWTFEQEGEQVKAVYDWKISAEKPLLQRLSFLMIPIFSANHHWAMARGLESLNLELRRLHTSTPEEQVKIPAPPSATPSAPLKWLAYVLGFRSSAEGKNLVAIFAPLEEFPRNVPSFSTRRRNNGCGGRSARAPT